MSTVRTYGTVAGEFVAFTGTRGGVACCEPAAVEAFVATLTGYQVKTVEQNLCVLRSFLTFASADGLIDAAVADAVPAARSSKQAGVPSVWGPGEVERILEAIDRGNPCGKRDYAIVLLIARLGLRGIDLKRLEFGDFDWPGNRLSVTQAKTGDRVQLPLLKDVGWAVIDYIRDGRPVCDCPQVFVRHTAPIGPFSDQDHLHQILVKHARAAHVPISEKRRHGMHSLRHTLATSYDRTFRCPTSVTSSAMSTYRLPRSTHAPPPKPNAEPSKPPTSTSSPTTCPNGTKIPDCSTGSPRSEAPPSTLCAALGPRTRLHQARWPTLRITRHCS